MTKQELLEENKKLKNLVKEGKEIFTFLNNALGLEKAAKSNFFMGKIATIITKVQRNPEIFNDVIKYTEKIQKIKLDENA